MSKNYFIRTRRTIQAGKPAIKRLSRLWGDRLVCVRYKYDYLQKRMYKTVELLVDDKPWNPSENDPLLKKVCRLKVKYEEREIRRSIKQNGGVWNSDKVCWEVDLGTILKLNLIKRIID